MILSVLTRWPLAAAYVKYNTSSTQKAACEVQNRINFLCAAEDDVAVKHSGLASTPASRKASDHAHAAKRERNTGQWMLGRSSGMSEKQTCGHTMATTSACACRARCAASVASARFKVVTSTFSPDMSTLVP